MSDELLEMDKEFIRKMRRKEFRVYYQEAVNSLINESSPDDYYLPYLAATRILDKTYKESIKRIRIRERFRQHDVKARLEEFSFAAKLYSFVKRIAAEHLERDGLIKKVS